MTDTKRFDLVGRIFMRVLVLALIAIASLACDPNAANRTTTPSEMIQFQLDGMRRTGGAL
ncbi:MAG: hypothetical protein M3680_36570 [Myxococcota bacterium]|nr:hypothetical protein [Myxococcota bacterium]